MFEVTKETIIADIMMNAPQTMPLFQEIGMRVANRTDKRRRD